MFGLGKKENGMVSPTVTNGAQSEAPFRMEFAPGIVLIEAEIRDRNSLAVFVNALNAMGALLPESGLPAEKPALPAPVVTPVPPVVATHTLDLTANPPTFAPATAEAPGPTETQTAPPVPPLTNVNLE